MTYRWTCSICGETHDGLPLSWAFAAPDHWAELDEAEREERGFCNADFCQMTDDAGDPARFVRGTIEIPIADPVDADEPNVVIGVWASLSEKSLEELLRVWNDDEADAGPWFGWLSNHIPMYPETLGVPTHVHFRPGLRPLIEVEPGDHPLARDSGGVTMARAIELAEGWVHSLSDRPPAGLSA